MSIRVVQETLLVIRLTKQETALLRYCAFDGRIILCFTLMNMKQQIIWSTSNMCLSKASM